MKITEKLTKPVLETKYLCVENTERYRPIMRFFFQYHEKLQFSLYKEDVYQALKDHPLFSDYTLELCEQDLLKLTEWGNLTNMQDTTNVNTVEEFKNRKFRYQPTEYAIKIERMVMELETLNVEKASLEPKLFEKLRLLLTDITQLTDLSDMNNCFEEINETFKKLNQNYQDFLKIFYEAKSEELMQKDAFIAYKDQVIEYLKKFLSGFQVNEIKIKKLLEKYPSNFEDVLIEKVMAYKKSQPILEADFDFDYLEEVLRGKWQTLIKWFRDTKGEESETERLKQTINHIIHNITKYVVSIMESNTNVNRMEEYRHILSLFLNTQNLTEAEQLSTVVFGIEKVKHFSNIDMESDSISANVHDFNPTDIELKSHSRVIKEKTVKEQVASKFFEKEAQLKAILLEKEKKSQLLKKYIEQGGIVIQELDVVEPFERKFILDLITKGLDKEKAHNTEFGVSYKVEHLNQESIQLQSVDGILTMDNIKITFEGD